MEPDHGFSSQTMITLCIKVVKDKKSYRYSMQEPGTQAETGSDAGISLLKENTIGDIMRMKLYQRKKVVEEAEAEAVFTVFPYKIRSFSSIKMN